MKKEITKKQIIKKIEDNKHKIKKFKVKKIGLFGSFAKGEEHKKSDVDILVEFEKPTFDNYMNLLYLLKKLVKRKVDLIIESDLKPELEYIKKEVEYAEI